MVAPGTPVSFHPAPYPSKDIKLIGKYVTIVGVSPTHAEAMFEQTSGATNTLLFQYLFDGPYPSISAYESTLSTQAADNVTIFYTILLHDRTNASHAPKPVGRAALMRIDPANRVLEVGNILFSPLLQKTPAATEAMYLLAKYVFQDLGYRRYEWKCNSLNEPSQRAARRLGFQFEGVFRQHMVQRGRSRDTAWFAMIDEDWVGGVGDAFEKWLDEGNFDEGGRQRRRLEEFRGD